MGLTGKAAAAAFAAIFVCLMSAGLYGVERFPAPEFDSEYRLPETSYPGTAAETEGYIALGALFAALAAATWLAHKRRSRKGIFALMIVSLLYFGFYRKGCICAVGSLQNVTLGLFDSSYGIPLTVLGFFLLPLVFSVLFGRTFCAAVCPLGAIQDVVVLKPQRVPGWLEHALGMGAYVYLAAAILFAATGTGFLICRTDPFVSFFRLGGDPTLLAVGAGILVVGIFIARPYCRYLCPYGVLLGWASRFSKWHITITPDECVKCRLCEEACLFGAIRKPPPPKEDESRERGVRRLAVILALTPVLVLGGGWVGGHLAGPLSRANTRVKLAEEIRELSEGRVEAATLEGEAFLASGAPRGELYAEAASVGDRFTVGGWTLGGFLGLVFAWKLLGLSVVRTREDYEMDRAACLSCGRCFSYCPREQERLKKAKEARA